MNGKADGMTDELADRSMDGWMEYLTDGWVDWMARQMKTIPLYIGLSQTLCMMESLSIAPLTYI